MLGRQTVAQPHCQFERLLVVHGFEHSTRAHQYTITDGGCLLLSDKLLGTWIITPCFQSSRIALVIKRFTTLSAHTSFPFVQSSQPRTALHESSQKRRPPAGLPLYGRKNALSC